MERQIVDIEYDDSHTCIAKIVEDLGTEYKVSLLEYYGYELWKFDDEECEIVSKDSVSGFYDTKAFRKRIKNSYRENLTRTKNEPSIRNRT